MNTMRATWAALGAVTATVITLSSALAEPGTGSGDGGVSSIEARIEAVHKAALEDYEGLEIEAGIDKLRATVDNCAATQTCGHPAMGRTHMLLGAFLAGASRITRGRLWPSFKVFRLTAN